MVQRSPTKEQHIRVALVGITPDGAVGLAPYYLKAYAEKDPGLAARYEISVHFFDTRDPAVELFAELAAIGPDIVGFSTYVWNVQKVIEVSSLLKHAIPDLVVVIGGPEVEFNEANLMSSCPQANYIVTGEGEASFAELLRSLAFGQPAAEGLLGVTWRSDDQVISNPPRPLIENLDDIPSPILTGLLDLNQIGAGLGAFETYRGCTMACRFCKWGPVRQRYFLLPRVVAELEKICASNLRWVWWVDAIFNINRKRTHTIVQTLRQLNHQGICFILELFAEFLDDEQIEYFAEMQDFLQLNFGLQTVTPEALRNSHRYFDPVRFSRNLRKLKEKAPDLSYKVDIIYGLPGDNLSGVKNSLDFAMQLQPPRVEYQNFLLLPGTSFHQRRREFGIHVHPDHPHMVTHTDSFPPAEMQLAAKLLAGVAFYNSGLLDAWWPAVWKGLGKSPGDMLLDLSLWCFAEMGWPTELASLYTQSLPELLVTFPKDPRRLALQKLVLLRFCRALGEKSGMERLVTLLEQLVEANYRGASERFRLSSRAHEAKDAPDNSHLGGYGRRLDEKSATLLYDLAGFDFDLAQRDLQTAMLARAPAQVTAGGVVRLQALS